MTDFFYIAQKFSHKQQILQLMDLLFSGICDILELLE